MTGGASVINLTESSAAFDRQIKIESQILDNLQEDEIIEYDVNTLEELNLGMLQDADLETNTIFIAIRNKLVAFYKKYDAYKMKGDLTQLDLSDPPTKLELNALNQRLTLMKSLKKLLRVAITTFDPLMRMKHLSRLY